jgi:hypothetical protein
MRLFGLGFLGRLLDPKQGEEQLPHQGRLGDVLPLRESPKASFDLGSHSNLEESAG